MKKINYLVIGIIVLFTLNSCEKNEKEKLEVEDENGFPIEKFYKDWNFFSVEYNGDVYYGCDQDIKEKSYFFNFDLTNVTSETMDLNVHCLLDDNRSKTVYRNYYFEDNILIVGEELDHILVFEIINYNKFNGNILLLKYIDCENVNKDNQLIGAVFTLKS